MDNYYCTAERIYEDVDLLFREKRYFNTCYLGGYVLECYAKLVLNQIFGVTMIELKKFSHRIDDINKELLQYISISTTGGSAPGTYLFDLKAKCPTVCTSSEKWNPNNRYDDGTGLWGAAVAQSYYHEMTELILLLVQMKIDGVIK